MKRVLILSILFFATMACKEGSKTNTLAESSQNYSDLSPLEVVNKRMNYFNKHNYEEFIKLYDKNVAVYTYPDKLMGKGSDRLSSIFKTDFENKSVSVKIENQMFNGPYVINHEIVTQNGKEQKYISIYKVERGLISSVSFVREF
ncbi:hypothetical protein [uncultured Tenacibaculum sp.]|uniref:hypothetical protein n=1 Tax=uncultured Tenacibaculum sp. TaxID=174713 RepID=UPI00260CCD25|nr:hypothetical protein [uncultured Tenacibaculum sp.]